MPKDSDAPATKKDLQSVETKLEGRMASVETKLDQLSEQMRNMQAETDAKFEASYERMCDMQTELLRAFGPWQQQAAIQFRELEANTGNRSQR